MKSKDFIKFTLMRCKMLQINQNSKCYTKKDKANKKMKMLVQSTNEKPNAQQSRTDDTCKKKFVHRLSPIAINIPPTPKRIAPDTLY